MRAHAVAPVALALFLAAACSTPTHGGDASTDAAADVPLAVCTEATPIHSIYPGPLYLRAGASAQIELRLAHDRRLCPATYTFTSDNPATLSTDATATIGTPHGAATFTVTAVAAGHTQLHVAQTMPASSAANTTSVIDVFVLAPTAPACPATTAAATGHLAPGTTVAGAAGTPLETASVSAPAGATTLLPVDVSIACAPDQLPAGYDAVGPAVSFGPATGARFPREIPLTIPINPALVPPLYELQTEIAYTAPGFRAPRIVPLANTRFTPDGRALSFLSLRLGTFQAVVRHGLGTHALSRHLTYRAIFGVSMGGLGSSMIATRHPDLFDAIVPLGGPADWGFFGAFGYRWHLGGFCTRAQRDAMGDAACAMATNDRTAVPEDIYMNRQNFEWWFYPDGTNGNGGSFNRDTYTSIYRDLTHMLSNFLVQPDPANGVLPLGVPATELARSDADRCATPVTIASGYYDDEYNPDGSYPVITFCDGNNVPGHNGEWAGGQGSIPFEMSVAVDYNRNSVRDAGEPVVRNLYEPFRDVGPDGLADADEPGYDALSNPDPSQDDYDRQFNPGGLEGNYLYDRGEPFDDVGLDGVRCPVASCPYDVGEGNHTFDMTAGAVDFLAHNARGLYAALPGAEADRLAVWTDGGTRDLMSFGAVANHFAGALAQQNVGSHRFRNFSALITGRPVSPTDDTAFVHTDVDYEHLPRHAMLQYGFDDATAAQITAGDGEHVGTVDQLTNRVYASLGWMQAQWPGGDRRPASNMVQADDAGRCQNGNSCSFTFHSTRANRDGPVSMYLPPGYHDPANAGVTYPVVYMLHGYGMQAMDLAASGLLLVSDMASSSLAEWQRPQKYIMVFPDGRCRPGDNCPNGTFYLDSPNANTAQIETFFLDLYDYVNANYRARPAADVMVTE